MKMINNILIPGKILIYKYILQRQPMKLELNRFSSSADSTLGILSDITYGRKFLCFTLEDEYRTSKLHGETRIPTSTYELKLRTTGGFHNRYVSKFHDFHIGMLHLQNVPGFEYILLHVGNDDDDTEGCILLGDTSQQNVTKDGFVGSSVNAYRRVYPPIADALDRGIQVTLKIVDFDSV